MAWITVDQMREEILRVYPEDGWRYKVLEMSDRQVAAIYNRMLSKGKLKKEPIFKKKPDISYETVVAEAKKYGEYYGEQLKFKI